MQYRAFLSYSRQDDKVANWLHRQLDGYRTPKPLVGAEGPFGPVPPKLHPIYRDRTDASGGGHLTAKIESALRDSATLIVLCSPAAVASPWVEREVQTFLGFQGEERIFPVIASDLPETADVERDYFPPALRGRGLLAADLREIRLSNGKMVGDGRDGARLKLIAGLLNVGLDQLVQRERVAERRRRIAAYTIAIAMGVLGIGAAAAGTFALIQRDVAVREQARAEKGEADAKAAQALAERNAREREEQRVLATYNAGQANIQRQTAEANAKEATAQRDRAFNNLARTFADNAWRAIDRGDLALAARYALAGWRIAPANVEDYRAVLGAALQAGHDTIFPAPPGLSMGYDDQLDISRDGRRIAAAYWAAGSPGRDSVVVWQRSQTGDWSEEQVIEGNLAAFSPDGARVAIGRTRDGMVRIHDVASGAELVSMQAGRERDGIDSVAFSPDGASLITAAIDTVLWDARTGQERLRLTVKEEPWRAIFSPDGRFIIVCGKKGTAVYDASTGEKLRDLPAIERFGPQPFSPDGERMVGLADSKIVVINFATGETADTIINKRGYVDGSPSFSSDGDSVLAPSEDQTAVIWDLITGEERAVFRGHTNIVAVAVFNPADGSIVTAAADDNVRIWAGDGHRQVWGLKDSRVFDIKIDDAGPHVGISGDIERRVEHVATGKSDRYPTSLSRAYLNHEGDALLVQRDYMTVDVMGPGGAKKTTLPAVSAGDRRHLLSDVVAGPGLRRFVTSHYPENINWPRQVRLWDEEGKLVASIPEDTATDFVFSPSGDRLLVVGDRSQAIYDTQTGRKLFDFKADTNMEGPLFSPDGKLIASGRSNSAMLWDSRTGKGLNLLDPGGTPRAFSRDGKLLAFSSGAIWETGTGVFRVSIGLNSSYSMAFSPDATRLLGVSGVGIHVWDPVTGRKLATLASYDHDSDRNPKAAWISPDGKLAFGSSALVGTWDISRLTMPMPQLAALTCERFLPEEAQRFSAAEIAADPLIRDMWQSTPKTSRDIVLPSKPPEGGGTWLALTQEGFQYQGGEPRNVCTGKTATTE